MERVKKELQEIKYWYLRGLSRTNWKRVCAASLILAGPLLFGPISFMRNVFCFCLLTAVIFLTAPALVGRELMIEEWKKND